MVALWVELLSQSTVRHLDTVARVEAGGRGREEGDGGGGGRRGRIATEQKQDVKLSY